MRHSVALSVFGTDAVTRDKLRHWVFTTREYAKLHDSHKRNPCDTVSCLFAIHERVITVSEESVRTERQRDG